MTSEFTRDYATEQLRRSRNPFRRLIKSLYIRNILQEVIGPSIDFACGAGQLLARLPLGSVGIEVNPYLIRELEDMGLNVIHYNPEDDQFLLLDLPERQYTTFIMAHVLEHFTNPAQILQTLLRSCKRIGIQRVILILPGWKGYQTDHTHKTFVNSHYLQTQGLLCSEDYQLRTLRYFPGNKESFGRYFVFHELIVVLDRVG